MIQFDIQYTTVFQIHSTKFSPWSCHMKHIQATTESVNMPETIHKIPHIWICPKIETNTKALPNETNTVIRVNLSSANDGNKAALWKIANISYAYKTTLSRKYDWETNQRRQIIFGAHHLSNTLHIACMYIRKIRLKVAFDFKFSDPNIVYVHYL